MNGGSLVLAAEGPGEWHIPSLSELFEYPPYWFSEGWTFFGLFSIEFNRVAMLTMLSTVVVAAIMVGAFRNPQVVPGKFQTIGEGIVGFVRDFIVLEVIGPKGLRFVPFLTTLFVFIWVNNFFKVTPGIIFPTTGRMGLPAFLAFVSWTVFIVIGMKEQGPWHYIKGVAVPPGVPAPVLIVLAPIEIVSTFIVRPLTLSIRLFANMMAGHIIIALSTIAANAFLFNFYDLSFNLDWTLPIGLAMLFAAPLAFAFEAGVSTIQAYIFTILTAVYIAGAIEPEH
jgi:F-type H+-transporting ATPase subunit a